MAKDLKKQPRPKAETPKGFRDYFGADVTERKQMLDRITEIYHRHGFEPLETSAVETVEALGKFLPDVDRPNAGVFAWQEAEVPGGGAGDWLALRYDLTAPLARVAAQFRNDLPSPYRRYAMGPVWRNEKPGPGRFRQFYQCDADTVGTASVAADAEICAMLSAALEHAGIPCGDYLIRINNRKVLNGILEAMGVTEGASADEVLRTIDKFDKVGEEGVRQLLTSGRKDDSGAFIEGVGLSPEQAGPVIAFLTSKGANNAETLGNLRAAVGASAVGAEGVEELPVQGDARTLVIVLGNLIGNAVKFTPPGGTVTLTLTPTATGRGVRFSCEDTGMGIPANEIDSLFTSFTRASNAAAQQIPGTGLGLVIVRTIVEQHGGVVGLRSSEGEGTTVTVDLPLAPVQKKAAP